MEDKVYDVMVIALPDGQVAHIPADPSLAQAVMREWQESLTNEQVALYKSAGVCSGAVVIRMITADIKQLKVHPIVQRVQAANEFQSLMQLLGMPT